MKKNHIIISSAIIAVLLLQFALRPFLYRREAARVMKTVFSCWKDGLTLEALYYFADPSNSIPIYALSSYEIKNQKFKRINNLKSYVFIAHLVFPFNNIFPSEKDWEIVLSDTPDGWKIISTTIIEN